MNAYKNALKNESETFLVSVHILVMIFGFIDEVLLHVNAVLINLKLKNDNEIKVKLC